MTHTHRERDGTLYLDMASSKALMRAESSHKSPSFPISLLYREVENFFTVRLCVNCKTLPSSFS